MQVRKKKNLIHRFTHGLINHFTANRKICTGAFLARELTFAEAVISTRALLFRAHVWRWQRTSEFFPLCLTSCSESASIKKIFFRVTVASWEPKKRKKNRAGWRNRVESTMQIVFSLGFGKIIANCETLLQFVSFGRKQILPLLFLLLFFFSSNRPQNAAGGWEEHPPEGPCTH